MREESKKGGRRVPRGGGKGKAERVEVAAAKEGTKKEKESERASEPSSAFA